MLHVHNNDSGFELKLHFLLRQTNSLVDKLIYKIHLHFIHFIISFIKELQ